MNDFRQPKKKRPASLDGFIVNRPSGSVRPDQGLQAFNKYHRPNRTGSAPGSVRPIDAFHKNIDGFNSSTQSVISGSHRQAKSADITEPFSRQPVAQDVLQRNLTRHTTQHNQTTVRQDGRNSAAKPKKRLFGRKKGADKSAKKPKSKLKIGLRVSAVLGALLLLIGGGLAIRAFLISRNIFKGGGNSALLHNQDIDPSQLRGEGDGRINVMLLGKGGPEQKDGPDLTDTIIVASIDPLADEAALLSIPRDFWVKQPSGSASKINQVYYDAKQRTLNTYSYNQRDSNEAKDKSEQAGIEAMKTVVSETMGVPIHYYAMIDFAGFKKAVDTVGGVDINVSEDMAVQEHMWLAGTGRYNLDVGEGRQHFDGVRALAFARSRKTSARGDFARSERQRAVIVALKDKVLSMGTLANPVKVNQLMSDFSGQLATDFSVNEMLRLYDLAKEIPSDKIASVGLDEYVGGDMINGLSVQVPKAGLFDYTEIQNYVRNIMRDAFLKKEDAKVMILNGTDTVGLATQKSKELKSYGYNVTSVGDAPTNTYTQTVLVDLRAGANKYTRSYLEKRLGVTAVSSLPDSSIDAGDADFVIILGASPDNTTNP